MDTFLNLRTMQISFKYRIILWYTGLLVVILSSTSILFYNILGYKLRHGVEMELLGKIDFIEPLLSDSDFEGQCRSRGFLDRIISKRHYALYDIREQTDVFDDNYLLLIICGERQRYISDKYHEMNLLVDSIRISTGKVESVDIGEKEFLIYKIQMKGYSVYLGYELFVINSLEDRIIRIFILLLPIAIILSFFCGILITRRSFKYINSIITTASDISQNNLSKRINVPEKKDEIRLLIITLNSMVDRLEKALLVSKQFSQDAAHEIKTPLTIIRGEIESLITEETSNTISPTLESVIEEINFLSQIVNKLLLLSSLDTDKRRFGFTEINFSMLIKKVIDDIAIFAEQRNIKLLYDDIEPIIINGSEELMAIMIWNIIENAIKYSERDSSVFISIVAKKKNKILIFSVADSGIGIPQEDIDNIFNRFYRVEKSHSRKIEGTGLGLPICRWIVELHNGTIEVKSELGKGSEFIVTLKKSDRFPEVLL